ncbi:FBP domain-containing protein [Leucobacter chromiireducens]|uniref:FBP domain-containing protein n=1 Tax=Leucobacter chromiireducens TaxID=283877 RepID=UPI0013DDA7A7|nr:FBP domain-containing protein [Leucobacter chromiireducens]
MPPHTLSELRAALGNIDQPTRRTVRMSARPPRPAWSERDFLGWRDPSALQRGYLFTAHGGPLRGIMLTTTRTRTAAGRAVMCELCRIPRRFEQVSLFVAPTGLAERRMSTIGTYLCVDLDCNARVNALRPLTPLDPPAEELVAAHRAELASRAAAFIDGVLTPG